MNTRQDKINKLMAYQQAAVNQAITEGESSDCFDLPGARMYYEELSNTDLDMCIHELEECGLI